MRNLKVRRLLSPASHCLGPGYHDRSGLWPRVSAEAGCVLSLEDFRGAGSALRGANRHGKRRLQTTLTGASSMRVAGSERFGNSSSPPGVSSAESPLLHMRTPDWNTLVLQEGACCPFPTHPQPLFGAP